MVFFQAVFLGIIQGLTEFLPVSSSGHLVILQKLLKINEPPVLFDILVHIGTLFSVVIFFNKKLLNFYLKLNNLKLIIIGTIPALIVGLFLNHYIRIIFNSLSLVGVSLLITAALLFSTQFIQKLTKNLDNISAFDALFIGLFQALAILPGVSRSGSTLVAGLWRKLNRETAFAFSFYFGLPAMVGALVLQIPDVLENPGEVRAGLIGLVVSIFSGLVALKIMKRVILKGKLEYFGIYCLALGLFLLVFPLLGK